MEPQMTTLADYEGQVSDKKDAYLGYLLWYSVSDLRIVHTDLMQALARAGISSAVPPVPKDVDVFRRVSSDAQRVKVRSANEGELFNYLVRRTDERDQETVRRIIVKETVDQKGKRLSYQELYFIDFHRDHSSITYGPLPGMLQEMVADDICDTIFQEYQKWRNCLNAYAIREFIRRLVLDMHATRVRESGGVYFVTADRQEDLHKIEVFIAAISDADFHTLPLVDDQKQRGMIQRAFEAETADAIDSLLAEIQEISTGTKQISSDKYADIVTKFQNLTAKTREYEGILETALGNTDSRLKIFQQSVMSLRAHVDLSS